MLVEETTAVGLSPFFLVSTGRFKYASDTLAAVWISFRPRSERGKSLHLKMSQSSNWRSDGVKYSLAAVWISFRPRSERGKSLHLKKYRQSSIWRSDGDNYSICSRVLSET
jgi:hypothetical protein